MTATTIRPAYGDWPGINQRLREAVADLTDEQLARSPAPDRWPLWATVGHLACQRVFWLCDAAGEPGAGSTPFPNAAFDCPGDDDLDHVLDADALAEALDATFRIVEACLNSLQVERVCRRVGTLSDRRLADADNTISPADICHRFSPSHAR